MRNATLPLAPAALHTAHTALAALIGAGEQSVSFHYTARDGSQSERSGIVLDFHGDSLMSSGSVRLLTDKGERVFNLAGMTW